MLAPRVHWLVTLTWSSRYLNKTVTESVLWYVQTFPEDCSRQTMRAMLIRCDGTSGVSSLTQH